jgi:hypothetical protein
MIIEEFRRVAVHPSSLLVHGGGALMRRDVPVLVHSTVTPITGLTHHLTCHGARPENCPASVIR